MDEKSDWIEISPGEKLSYTVNLNDYYAFLPAKHQYDIGTVEFTLVNSNWFLEQHIYDLFLLLWMNDTISSVKTLLALLGSISISRGSYVRLIVGGGALYRNS